MLLLRIAYWLCRGFFNRSTALMLENLALRQQLALFQRSAPRPRLRGSDRWFWVWLSRWCADWQSWLLVVQPATVIRWHRQGFRMFWRWQSRRRVGRPPVDAEIRQRIRQMARDNPTWGAPRIGSELRLLGLPVADSTVAKSLPRPRKPPSQSWKTFRKNHLGSLASIDFFVVPTATFKGLHVFLVLCHDRRRIMHFNVTRHPTAQWVSQQFREAFSFKTAPRYLIRDRDSIYGSEVRHTLEYRDSEEVVTAPRNPWQNPFVERVIGSIRRECLDHVIVLHERHLHRIVSEYLTYYHLDRPHLSLDRNSPCPRVVEPPALGRVVAEPIVNGLHHRYGRVA